MVEKTHEPKLGNMVDISGDVIAGRADSVERRVQRFNIFLRHLEAIGLLQPPKGKGLKLVKM